MKDHFIQFSVAMAFTFLLSNTAFGVEDDAARREQEQAAQRAVRRFEIGPPGATAVYTTSNGITLGLEFARTSIVAGERLTGTMTVSNASALTALLVGELENRTDTGIGTFIVVDEAGNTLPRTLPAYYMQSGIRGSKDEPLAPGLSRRFAGDVVWGYSLTIPGNYLVKARARLPLTNDTGSFATFQADTPEIAITVRPRPEGSPPLGNMYTNGLNAEQLERFNALEARQAARMARDKPPVPQVPRVVPRESTARPPQPVASGAHDQSVNGTTPAKTEIPVLPSRGFLFGLIPVVLSGALVIYLVWSRRKHDHP